MNWSKIKNIIIILLCVVNLFLLVSMGFNNFASKKLPEGASDSFVAVLKERGITIADEFVPERFELRREVEAKFYDLDSLVKMFVGEKVQYSGSGSSIVASNNNKRLTVKNRNIEYTTLKKPVEKNGKDIIKAMEKLGISTQGAIFSPDDGLIKVEIDGQELSGVYLDVSLSSDGEICFMSGVWPMVTIGEKGVKTSLLAAISDICTSLPEGAEIKGVDAIYVLEATDAGCSVTPGWRVETKTENFVVKGN